MSIQSIAVRTVLCLSMAAGMSPAAVVSNTSASVSLVSPGCNGGDSMTGSSGAGASFSCDGWTLHAGATADMFSVNATVDINYAGAPPPVVNASAQASGQTTWDPIYFYGAGGSGFVSTFYSRQYDSLLGFAVAGADFGPCLGGAFNQCQIEFGSLYHIVLFATTIGDSNGVTFYEAYSHASVSLGPFSVFDANGQLLPDGGFNFVPEPATMWSLLAGVALLAFARRRIAR